VPPGSGGLERRPGAVTAEGTGARGEREHLVGDPALPEPRREGPALEQHHVHVDAGHGPEHPGQRDLTAREARTVVERQDPQRPHRGGPRDVVVEVTVPLRDLGPREGRRERATVVAGGQSTRIPAHGVETRRQGRRVAERHHEVGIEAEHRFGQTTFVAHERGRATGQRFKHDEAEPLPRAARDHRHVGRAVHVGERGTVDPSNEPDAGRTGRRRTGAQPRRLRSVAGDQQRTSAVGTLHLGPGVDEHVDAGTRHEPAHTRGHEVRRREVETGPGRRAVAGREAIGIHARRQDAHPPGRHPVALDDLGPEGTGQHHDRIGAAEYGPLDGPSQPRSGPTGPVLGHGLVGPRSVEVGDRGNPPERPEAQWEDAVEREVHVDDIGRRRCAGAGARDPAQARRE
jgi:hypothetical protein